MVPDVVYDASYVVSLLLSFYDFGHHVRIIVFGLELCCQTFTTRYCFVHGMVANRVAFLI